MGKLLKLLFKILFVALIIVLCIIVIKTVSYKSRQMEVDPIAKIDLDEQQLTKHLSEAIQIPTVSTSASIDTANFLRFHQYLQDEFVHVDSILEKKVVNDFSLVYKWQGFDPNLKPILLLGHMDVVPVEDISKDQWEVAPFSGALKDGFIFGRGTLDDKMNVLGILEAIERLLQENFKPQRSIYLAFGHDEEVGGKQGAVRIAKMFKEQGLSFDYVLDEGSVILEDAMPGLNKPACLIGIAEKGYTTLTLTSRLENGGHSAMPPQETAIGILSKAIQQLESNPFPAKISGATQELFNTVGPEMSLPNKAIFANLWLFKGVLKNQLSNSTTTNAVIRTTTAPTMLRGGIKDNVLPSSASAKVNFRILPGETIDFVLDYVNKTIDDERVLVTMSDNAFASNPSKVSSNESSGYKILQKTALEIFPNTVVAPSLVIAGTDSRHYENVADDIYRLMPLQIKKGELKRIHGINERIKVEDYLNAVRFYYRLIHNSCK